MNAWTTNRAAKKAAVSEYEKNAKEHAEHVAQSVLALMAYIMYSKWKCTPETCRKRVQDITDMLNAPQVFGQAILYKFSEREGARLWSMITLNKVVSVIWSI